MPTPNKITVSRGNNLGEVITADIHVDSRADRNGVALAMEAVLRVMDERFREMNRRLLGANANIKQLPPEQQQIWYQTLDMLYGNFPVPQDVEAKVREASAESQPFSGGEQMALPEPETA